MGLIRRINIAVGCHGAMKIDPSRHVETNADANVIQELKIDASDIHLLIPDDSTNYNDVDFLGDS